MAAHVSMTRLPLDDDLHQVMSHRGVIDAGRIRPEVVQEEPDLRVPPRKLLDVLVTQVCGAGIRPGTFEHRDIAPSEQRVDPSTGSGVTRVTEPGPAVGHDVAE